MCLETYVKDFLRIDGYKFLLMKMPITSESLFPILHDIRKTMTNSPFPKVRIEIIWEVYTQ